MSSVRQVSDSCGDNSHLIKLASRCLLTFNLKTITFSVNMFLDVLIILGKLPVAMKHFIFISVNERKMCRDSLVST